MICRHDEIGRHSRLKIPRAGCSTQSEKCLQTANFFKFDYLCFGASLQLHIPSFEGIEYAAMMEW